MLNNEINKRNISAKTLSLETGISQSQISEYRHGVEPTDEKKNKILKYFGIHIEENKNKKSNDVEIITVNEASKIIGMTVEMLKLALENDLFKPQIGFKITCNNSNRYFIFKERLNKYLTGEM